MEIHGQWNTYKCNDCQIDFAIRKEHDDIVEVKCPRCEDWLSVTDEGPDFIER